MANETARAAPRDRNVIDEGHSQSASKLRRFLGKVWDAIVSKGVEAALGLLAIAGTTLAYGFREWLSAPAEQIPNWLMAALVVVAVISIGDWIWRLVGLKRGPCPSAPVLFVPALGGLLLGR